MLLIACLAGVTGVAVAVSPSLPGTTVVEGWWRDARDTLASHSQPTGRCPKCGKNIYLGRESCLGCEGREVGERTRTWVGDRLDDARDGWRQLRELQVPPEVRQHWHQICEFLEQHESDRERIEREQRRQLYESAGQWSLGSSGRSLDDMARSLIEQWAPSLLETDFGANPSRALSYLLAVDLRGFMREVRFIRGPHGQPMTVLDALSHYGRLDPARAGEIVDMVDDLSVMLRPGPIDRKLPLLLRNLRRTLRLVDPR